eukprot:g1780.t1
MADILTADATVTVSSEAEFNAAISKVNAGEASTIDIAASFSLSGDTTAFEKDAVVTSSTNSEIHDVGFAVLTVNLGACVTFGVRATGTGRSIINGNGDNSCLKGVTGGALPNLTVGDDAGFEIPSGERFTIDGNLTLGVFGGLKLGGILFNRLPVETAQSIIIVNGTPEGQSGRNSLEEDLRLAQPAMGPLTLEDESSVKIDPGVFFIVGQTSINKICQVCSDGTASLWSKDTIEVVGNNFQDPGSIQGTNVHKIELKDGGKFSGVITGSHPHGVFNGNTAHTIINTSGDFQMGSTGTCTVKNYQQSGGNLKFQIDNFKGETAHLTLSETVDVTGGALEINAGLYYVPAGTQSTVSTLITAPGSSIGLQNLAQRARFNAFPDGLTPTVRISGDTLELVLTLSS